jgi:putative transposase
VREAAPLTGTARACAAVQISRAAYYRQGQDAATRTPDPSAPPTRSSGRPALTQQQRERILEELFSERFVDRAPRQVYAALLDEGVYLCSWRSMYRLLKDKQASGERRPVRHHPKYHKPELVATAPNRVWSWDITYLKTRVRGRFYYLYVAMDIFSRYVVGWLLADRECQELAKQLLSETIQKQHVVPGELTLHADRGAPMKSQSVSDLLEKLGVERSHGRPRVSNDNPYSEAGFRTLKYRPEFPERFSDMAGGSVLPALLCLVQHGALPYGHRAADAGAGPLRSSVCGPGPAAGGPGRGVRAKPAAVRGPAPERWEVACAGLDQCARDRSECCWCLGGGVTRLARPV